MRSTFFGIEMARRAIMTQQRGMDITGHNIANANSPGYSRQRGVQSATHPYAVPAFNRPAYPGQYGTGVEMSSVERLHDAFVQTQINRETQAMGQWEAKREVLTELEMIFLEPSDTGIPDAMDEFWTSLEELHKNPESIPVRTEVIERAKALTSTIRHARNQLVPLRDDIEQTIQTELSTLNSLGSQVAAVNRQIAQVLGVGDNPNDLYDKRDALLTEIAKLAGTQVVNRDNGQVSILVGGVALVDGSNHNTLSMDSTTGNITWDRSGRPAQFTDGRLKGLVEARDDLLPQYADMLDTFAVTLMNEINAIHQNGFDLNGANGVDFFLGTDATDIILNPFIEDDAVHIAAADTWDPSPGNGQTALAMAQLRFSRVMGGGTATLDEFYAARVAELGIQGQEADRYMEQQEILLGQLDALRASVSGVSLDEEVANLLQQQHAYNAAARMLTTVDEALDVIINRMGLVGR